MNLKRQTRRQFINGAAFAAGAAALAACAPAQPEAPLPTPQLVVPPVSVATPVPADEPFVLNGVTLPFSRNETVVMDQGAFTVFDRFNPYMPNGVEFAAGWWQISTEYLWYANYATGEIVPWLAESYSYSQDYTELTIKIREGITWNDGQPFTANDIAFTQNMLRGEALARLDPEKYLEAVVIDDLTVVLPFTEPMPRAHHAFICRICTGRPIMAKHIWDGQDPNTFPNYPPVTTGPYMLDRTYVEQRMFVWKRNENYWNKANYPLAANFVVYRAGPPAELLLTEVGENLMDLHGMDYKIWVENQAAIPQINMVVYVDPCPRGAFFNCAKPPFDKPEFRRAMSKLMNRPVWGERMWIPPSKPAVGFWADYRTLDKFINHDANETWGILNYDPEGALELLEGLGYTQAGGAMVDAQGMPLVFEVGTPVGPGGWEYLMALDFVEGLQAHGIDATLRNYDGPVFWDKIGFGDFDMGFWWMCGATIDPLELFGGFHSEFVVPIGERETRGNAMRVSDPELDRLIEELRVVRTDAPNAMDLYMEIYDEFSRVAPGVPLIQTYYTACFNTTYWDGMPSTENLYTVPFNWWGQIMFVLLRITARA